MIPLDLYNIRQDLNLTKQDLENHLEIEHDTRAVNSIDSLDGTWWSGGERRMPWQTPQQMWDETPSEGLRRMYTERMGKPIDFPWEDIYTGQVHKIPSIFGSR